MSRFNRFGLIAAFVLSAAIAAAAQVPAKSVLLNTASFYDEKAGITKLVAAEKQLDSEFGKDIKDLQADNAKLAIIAEELQKPVTEANRAAMLLKKEEGDSLQRRMGLKKGDLEAAINKRREILIGPITFDIGKAIAEFGKKNNYGAIYDSAKMLESGILIFIGESTDITKDFIAYYNARAAAVPVK